MIIIPIKWLFHWELFGIYPIFRQTHMLFNVHVMFSFTLHLWSIHFNTVFLAQWPCNFRSTRLDHQEAAPLDEPVFEKPTRCGKHNGWFQRIYPLVI